MIVSKYEENVIVTSFKVINVIISITATRKVFQSFAILKDVVIFRSEAS